MSAKIHYWKLNARASLSILICEVAKIPYEIVDAAGRWPGELKAQTPFGQLPFLEFGDVKMAQSMAIARFLARKGHLSGDTDQEVAISEMLIEEQNDIYNILVKAQYAANKAEEYKKALETTLPAHFANLEKLLPEHAKHFGPSKVLAGDLAIFTVLTMINHFAPDALKSYAKLAAFYQHIAKSEGGAKFLALGLKAYFSP